MKRLERGDILANKEIYRLDIKVGVSGDSETKSKLTAVEKMTQQIEKKAKVLNKLKVNPTAKLNDHMSSAIDKINNKAKGLKKLVVSSTVKLNDQATNKLNKVRTTLKSIDKTNITANLKINDQTSTYLDKVHAKGNKLKDANINPTAKVADEASSKFDRIKKAEDKIKDKKVKISAEDKASNTLKSIQDKINGWIKAGAKKVISLGIAGTIAAGGIGLGTSIKTYSEYEKGLSNVKAVTNATASQMKQLDAAAKQYGSTTAWSARHVTQAEELLGQAGFSVEETISALPGLLNLASAGDLDLAAATDIASGTLRAFNLNAKDSSHVADVLALSASATNSDVTDLGETMKYVAPVSQALGISLEDTAAASGLLSNANIKGSQAGTVLRQTMARLASPTKEASDVMKKYGINAFDANGNMKPLSSVVDNLNSSLGKLTSQQRADVISTIFGTESMSGVLALMNQGGKSVGDLSKQLKDANGAAQKMSDTKLDNLQGQWIKLKAAVEHMQITLGEKLAPYAKQFVTWLTGKMPAITDGVVKFVDYLSKNTETIKSLAITVLGLGAAFATLSAIGSLGNTITGIKSLVGILKGAGVAAETTAIAGGLKNIGLMGKLLPAILSPAGLAIAGVAVVAGSAIIANNNLMKKSLSTTTEELGPVEKIMNKLNGSIYKSKAEAQRLGLVYDDFGSGVSDNFKKAAQDASKSLLQIEMNIKNLTLGGKMDEAGINKFKNYVNDFTNEGINAMKEKQSQIQAEFQKAFTINGVMSDAGKGVTEYLNSYFEEGINKELKIRDEVYGIGDKAIKDHGTLLDSDMELIKNKLAELKSIQLEYANAQSAGELAYSKSKFASKAERVTGIKGASDLLQERSKERDKSIDETKATYDKTITTTQYLMDHESDPGKKAKLEAGLKEASAARDKALDTAEKSWQSDLESLYKSYPDAKGKINKYTGAEFTGKDLESQKSLDSIKSKYTGLQNVTKDGFYGVKNSVTGAMSSIYVTVDKTTGEITGAWNTTTGQVAGYSSEMSQKAKELGSAYQSTAGAAIQSLIRMGASVNTSTGEIQNSFGGIIGKLHDVTVATDGTRTGIIDINNTPILITSNAQGQITDMRTLTDATKGIPSSASVTIDSNATSATADINATSNAINNIPASKTVTIAITKSVTTIVDFINSKTSPNQNANGTSFSQAGFSTLDERGWELSQGKSIPIIGSYNGDPLSYLSRGSKILNHMQSVENMKEEVSKQVNQKLVNQSKQPNQMQYQLIQQQPQQIQVAKADGLKFGNINVNVDGKQDLDKIVAQAAQEFAYKLKEALNNIKK